MICDLLIRAGSHDDKNRLLTLCDEAVAWLVARGQTGQWGSEPFSQQPLMRERVHALTTGGGLWLAERDGEAVGALVVSVAPEYVPPTEQPELYVNLLLTSRRFAGAGIGRRLMGFATQRARAQMAQRLRVDCWAGAPGLVGWYERQGFVRSGTFDLDGWTGQILTKDV